MGDEKMPVAVAVGQVRRDPDPNYSGGRFPVRTVTVLNGPHMMSKFRSHEELRWQVMSNGGRRSHIRDSALALWPIVDAGDSGMG
jgi:hypothetical protein